MTTASAIDEWLDKTYESEDVKGVILIDPSCGLSLGVRGVAHNGDAPYIRWYCNKEGIDTAKIDYRDYTIFIKTTDQVLIGIYKDLETNDNSNYSRALSYDGT